MGSDADKTKNAVNRPVCLRVFGVSIAEWERSWCAAWG
jgi:hypothetical protein